MTDRVVILGNSGFIGRALQAHFERSGAQVHGLASAQLDMRDSEALARLDGLVDPTCCIIVTSVVAPGSAMTPRALAENITMAANLASYLLDHPAGRCVYLSSDAVYPMIDAAVTESTETDVTALYALAKFASERVLEHAARAAKMPLLVVRPTAVYGPGDTHNGYGPNRFVRSLVNDKTIRLFGDGEETRDHIYIDDLVRTLAALIAADQNGLFNVATGTSYSFMQVAEILRNVASSPVEIVRTPRQGTITHRRFDISRLRAAVPDLEFTPLEQGLGATLLAAERRVVSA
ncbi:MAG: NAD-dependent epimerase/dehydratase family protein [Chloroflexi bacterium]|nr:NAD-dependent epimerase/dehydratase family protein [Chloroflexota bacterium]